MENKNIKSCVNCDRINCGVYNTCAINIRYFDCNPNVFADIAKECADYIGTTINCKKCQRNRDCNIYISLSKHNITKHFNTIAKYCIYYEPRPLPF